MRYHRALALLALASALTIAAPQLYAQQSDTQTQPDNTAKNKNYAQTPTADNQSNARSDRHISAHIRRAIIADKGLSTYAHNVKIITVNGQVTLRGPVHSEEEKQQVASDAASVVPAGSITNELTVKQ